MRLFVIYGLYEAYTQNKIIKKGELQMINYIWFFLILIGIIVAIFTGNIEVINTAIIEDAEEAVKFAIGLTGIMGVWLGLMNVAEKSGLIKSFSRLLRPITRMLFPDVPKDHPAMSAIIMNMVTNMFGAGNSATAIGIKAMEEMNAINNNKSKATNAMCMFLVVNMSSIQLVPLTVLKIRADAGSTAPTEIIGTSLIATAVSTIVGIISAKILQVRG
ncbi:nucleoside recognition domain-containing protein [Brassicibacter mesophilus]|uniref:nucleoside recognition domain-containing protein n=1 Tax=Brassicibacter mesophilus TaxID=745119 RepID=UPI003D251F8B